MDNDLTIGRTNVSGGGIWRSQSYDDETSSSSEEDDNDVVVAGTTAAAGAMAYPSKSPSSSTTTGTTSAAEETSSASKPPSATSAGGGLPSPPSTASLFQWPTNPSCYELGNCIGRGAFASVWAARIRRRTNVVVVQEEEEEGRRDDTDGQSGGDDEDDDVECAIKIMDLEHVNINISVGRDDFDIRLEVQTMRLSSHPNVLVCHTSFVRDTDLWLVTQLMSKGSSLHCLQSARAKLLADAADAAAAVSSATIKNTKACSGDVIYDDNDAALFTYTSDDTVLEGGLTARSSIINPESLVFESHITYILYETLLGLKYIHDNGKIHRDVKAGNILLDSRADVRIADFGVSSWLIDGGNRREHTTTFVGTPCWMAPEVMEQLDGYDYKADIWSLGITALELCKGYAPYAKFAPMKVLLLTIQEDPPSLDTYNDGDDVGLWSESFRSMIRLCLQKDPNRRPTCQELLAHRHFRPLADADGRADWRVRTRTEVCDVVVDVDKSTILPDGTTAVQCMTKKDRPAGTSWILPGSSSGTSPVEATSSLRSSSGRRDDQLDFFDEFEEQTGGENFNRESLAATHDGDDVESNDTKEEEAEESKKKEDVDDINDFFDEFEKTTGGENFRPGRHVG
ncbi:hypothetical protein ACHAXA_003205 [Cyclostephanos tholiformis]|uniref:Protein kinase domain-containing protein n=1 Tax=Cyclostephanos tholiformis TaxID=382380 RepID=A0ABD3RYH2_9STRA